MFIDLNGGRWHPDPPIVDESEAAMLSVAAVVEENWLSEWLRSRLVFDEPD